MIYFTTKLLFWPHIKCVLVIVLEISFLSLRLRFFSFFDHVLITF